MNIKYKCPCCGYYTFDVPTGKTFDICPICFWEDDGGEAGGANSVSLETAKENFRLYAACTPALISKVRYAKPLDRICADMGELLRKKVSVDSEKICAYISNRYKIIRKSDRFTLVYDEDDSIFAVIDIICGIVFITSGRAKEFRKYMSEYALDYIQMDDLRERNLIYKDAPPSSDGISDRISNQPFSVIEFVSNV